MLLFLLFQYETSLVPRSREVKQSYLSSIFTTLYATCYAFPLVITSQPDLVCIGFVEGLLKIKVHNVSKYKNVCGGFQEKICLKNID